MPFCDQARAKQLKTKNLARTCQSARDQLRRLGEEGPVEIVPQSVTRVSLIDISKARQAQIPSDRM
jgi:DNA-binding GntR family transcriptional regulator